MMKKWHLVVLVVFLGVCIWVGGNIFSKKEQKELLIFAAASLTDVLEELAKEFEAQNPEVKVNLNFASSGSLQIQIEQGARANLFISAGVKEMTALVKKGLVDKDSVKVFALNRLVIIEAKDSIDKFDGPSDLLRNEFENICLGDVLITPVGYYSAEALKKVAMWEKVQDRVVFARNVRQVLQYVETGEVDSGFVYLTDALSSSKVKISYIFPENYHPPIEYVAGIVFEQKNNIHTKEFMDWILSPEGQQILVKYGFQPVNRGN